MAIRGIGLDYDWDEVVLVLHRASSMSLSIVASPTLELHLDKATPQ